MIADEDGPQNGQTLEERIEELERDNEHLTSLVIRLRRKYREDTRDLFKEIECLSGRWKECEDALMVADRLVRYMGMEMNDDVLSATTKEYQTQRAVTKHGRDGILPMP